jgi:hypothetical protein
MLLEMDKVELRIDNQQRQVRLGADCAILQAASRRIDMHVSILVVEPNGRDLRGAIRQRSGQCRQERALQQVDVGRGNSLWSAHKVVSPDALRRSSAALGTF